MVSSFSSLGKSSWTPVFTSSETVQARYHGPILGSSSAQYSCSVLRAPSTFPTLNKSSLHSNVHRATRSKPRTPRSRLEYTLKPSIPVSGYRKMSPPLLPAQLRPSTCAFHTEGTSSCHSDNGQAAARDLPLSLPTPPNPNPPITASTHPSPVDGKLPSSPNDLQRSPNPDHQHTPDFGLVQPPPDIPALQPDWPWPISPSSFFKVIQTAYRGFGEITCILTRPISIRSCKWELQCLVPPG